jgi:hypothetical protein
MPKRHRIELPSGEEVQAEELSFEPVKEPWSVFELADGTYLRVRAQVVRVFQVVDEQGNPVYLPEGERHVVVRHRVEIIPTDVP